MDVPRLHHRCDAHDFPPAYVLRYSTVICSVGEGGGTSTSLSILDIYLCMRTRLAPPPHGPAAFACLASFRDPQGWIRHRPWTDGVCRYHTPTPPQLAALETDGEWESVDPTGWPESIAMRLKTYLCI